MSSPEFDTLKWLLDEFDVWAPSANKLNTDWPTDFPAYFEIVDAAAAAMRRLVETSEASDEVVSAIARVWSLMEETSPMIEESIAIGKQICGLLARLFEAGDRDTRWQVVEAAAKIGCGADIILKGTRDADSYVRRRSWYSLAKVAPLVYVKDAEAALAVEKDDSLRLAFEYYCAVAAAGPGASVEGLQGENPGELRYPNGQALCGEERKSSLTQFAHAFMRTTLDWSRSTNSFERLYSYMGRLEPCSMSDAVSPFRSRHHLLVLAQSENEVIRCTRESMLSFFLNRFPWMHDDYFIWSPEGCDACSICTHDNTWYTARARSTASGC